ncbi:transmembrane 220 family protein [Aquirufa echingensis]|jgi:hypothetical protein|uniref:Transmembrane 220 family protein n=1 Tax=Aquirufa echingensis TaxID=3096516 RepID=A0ABW6D4Q2_9BACT
MKTKKAISFLGILFSITFLLFTYWQFNDPDPILWVPIYGVATYVSFQAFRGMVNKELTLVLFVLSTFAGIQLWVEMTAWEGFMTDGLAMKTMNQELAREAVGLWIASFSFALYYLLEKK